MSVTGDGAGLVLVSERYASPSDRNREPVWDTFTYLRPAIIWTYTWPESVKSGDRLDLEPEVEPRLAATYRYPSSGAGNPSDA